MFVRSTTSPTSTKSTRAGTRLLTGALATLFASAGCEPATPMLPDPVAPPALPAEPSADVETHSLALSEGNPPTPAELEARAIAILAEQEQTDPKNLTILGKADQEMKGIGRSLAEFKVMDTAKEKFLQVALDRKTGDPVDHKALREAEREARRELEEAIHPLLKEKIKGTEPVPVAIWVRVPEAPPPAPGSDSPDELAKQREQLDQEHQAAAKIAAAAVAERIRADKTEATQHAVAPMVYAILTPAQIRKLARDPDVLDIQLVTVATPATGTAAYHQIGAHATDLNPGTPLTGAGVRVAVIESQGGWVATANPAFTGTGFTQLLTYMGGCNEYSSGGHATQVAGLIAGRREESDIFGLAPASWLVVAGSCSGSTAELQAVSSSAISQGVHIFNLSQEIDVGGWTDAHSRFYDSLANTSPFPTVIASAGNGGANYVRSPATGFNVIAVGNYNSGGQAWRGTNRTVNPTSSYNVRSTYNDRIKPDLSAPGTSLSTANPPDGATTVSGTSFAAAVVSGAAAQIMEQNPVLKYWPEATRAVLTASALDDLTAGNADGRGALYVRGAAAAARNNQFHVGSYTCGATPAERWVPLTAGVRTRIALTWSSDPNYAFPNEPSADLDIVVQNPGGFALSSWTWDNTTEKVDFVPTYSGLHRVVATVYRCSTARPTYWSMAWYQDFEAETSVLLPHYVYPTAGSGLSPAWQSVVTAANHYPHLKVLIVANAHSGQNDNSDSINYNTAIGIVQQSPRISALGYVATNDGNKDLTTVFNQIDRWLGNTDFSIGSQMFHYTNKVRGIFLDEADFGGYLGGDQAAFNTHYQTIRNYIVNTYPGKIVVANPGVSFAASFVQTGIDTFVGFEKGYWPSATDIQTISDRVGNVPSRLSVMVHSLAAPPSLSQINGVRGKVKYLITSPDPYVPDGAWNSPIPDDYFDLLFKRL